MGLASRCGDCGAVGFAAFPACYFVYSWWEVDTCTDGLCRGKRRPGVAPRMGCGTGWGLGTRRRDADIWRSIISGHIILL